MHYKTHGIQPHTISGIMETIEGLKKTIESLETQKGMDQKLKSVEEKLEEKLNTILKLVEKKWVLWRYHCHDNDKYVHKFILAQDFYLKVILNNL